MSDTLESIVVGKSLNGQVVVIFTDAKGNTTSVQLPEDKARFLVGELTFQLEGVVE